MKDWEKLFKKSNLSFHCETEEIAIEFLQIAHDLGYRWCNNKSYLETNSWESYKNNMCYDIYRGESSSVKYAQKYEFEVINVKNLLEGKRLPFKLNRK